MAEAPEVKVVLTAEDQGVAAAIKELGNQLSQLKQKQDETAGSAVNLANAFKAVVASAIVLKIVEFGKEVFNASVNIERMSQRTGLSAGFLSTFGKAAEKSRVSTEQVNLSLGRLATNITKFQQGGTGAAAAFKALNITQADFKNLTPDEKIRLVTERLGAMHAGLQKAEIAQSLMGRGGQALIPILDALAGEGFDKVTEAAKRSGQYLSDEMAASAANAAIAMAQLEGVGKGIATQFEAGLLPAITDVADALTHDIEEGGTSSFQKLGEYVGVVVKGIVLAWTIGANTIGAVLLTLYDVVKANFDELGNVVKTAATAAILASRGQFSEAGKALADGYKKGHDIAAAAVDDLTSRWTVLADIVTKQSATLFPTAPREKKAPPKEPEDAKADKARLSALEARLQNELALFKAKNAAEESLNQIAYNQGLESIQQFYAKKKALALAESAEQISILQRERSAIAASPTDGTDAANIAQKQKLAKLDNEIAVAKITSTQGQAALDSQQFLAEEAHQKTVQGYQAQILKAQGLTYQATVAQIEGEAAAIQRNLVQAGLTPTAVAALLSQIQQLKLATAAFDQDKKEGEDALRSLTNARDEINLKVQTGQMTQVQGELAIIALENQRLVGLRQLAAAMQAAAVSPEEKQQAEDFARSIDQIAAHANLAGQQVAQLKNGIISGLGGDLSTFLGSTIDSVKGVGDAFEKLGSSAVSTIQKIIANLLVQIITQKLTKALTHQDDGPAGVGIAAAKGTAQAAPLMTASAAMTTAGVTITSGATALGLSAATLQVAADTMMLAKPGLAGGGLISGPGTGTSDSISARLSDGEFVVRAAAVKAVGLHTLAAINRGISVPSVTGLSIARFAEGGLVQGGSGDDGMDLQLGIGLDEGLILKHLASKKAGRIVLRHLSDNPKAAGKALSRGQ
jgi:hypothetical protein